MASVAELNSARALNQSRRGLEEIKPRLQAHDGVRVLRVKYGAREKSVMHSHFSTSPAFIRQAALSVIRNKLQVISDTATAQELQFAEFC